MPSVWTVVLALFVVAHIGFTVCTLYLIHNLHGRLVLLTQAVNFLLDMTRLAAQRRENGKD